MTIRAIVLLLVAGALACDAETADPGDDEVVAPGPCSAIPPVWQGDVTVDDWSDRGAVSRLRCARAVTGALHLTGDRVDLPRLEAVGDLVIEPGVRAVSLPSLWSVAGHVGARQGVVLQELDLPRLARVGGSLTIGPIQTDAELVLPALTEVGRDLVVAAATPRLSMPGLVHVEGDLNLGDRIDALDLPALASVYGRLRIASSTLRDLSGLPALRWVHGDLDFYQTTALERIALPALHEIDGTVVVHHDAAAALTAIDLPAMEFFTSELTLSQLPTLERLSFGGGLPSKLTLWSMPALRTIDMPAVGALVVRDTGVEELSLPALLGTSIEIENNPALRRVHLGGRDGQEAAVRLRNNAALTSLTMPALTSGEVHVHDSPGLVTLELPKLARAKVSVIDGALADLRGLSALTEGSLVLQQLDIASLAGLSAVRTLSLLAITDCPALTTLAGLGAGASLQYVGLSRNRALVDLGSLAAYDLVATNATVVLTQLPITSLAGLERVPQGIGLSLQGNPSLTDVGALGHIRELRSLALHGNPRLSSLAGLAGLRTITEELFIVDSPSLTSLADLDALASVGGGIFVRDTAVPPAEIAAFRARLGR